MSKLRKKETIVMIATLALIVYTLSLSMLGPVVASLLTSRTISNTGTVKTIGVGVYWNFECTNAVSSIGWGTLKPGSSKNVTCYIRNEGNSISTLSFYTSNWNPSDAEGNMTLSWDYSGQLINPEEACTVTFTLSISASIEGITDFSFDILIESVPTPAPAYAMLKVTSTNPTGPDIPFTIDGASYHPNGTQYVDGNRLYNITATSHTIEFPESWTSPENQVTYYFSEWSDGVADNPRTVTLQLGSTLELHAVLTTSPNGSAAATPMVPTNGLRGNLHTHTTWSDGAETPYDMVMAYKNLGYDFVAITDHDVWTDVSGLQDLGIIVFEGIEHSGGEHWNEIRGGGETLTIKNHVNRYGDTAEEIIAGSWDVHEATDRGFVQSYYTTINHPYIYTDDAHGTWGAGKAWIIVDAELTVNVEENKAIIIQAIKAGNYVCQTA